jgi:F0F1-type ATP synthase delta subunit
MACYRVNFHLLYEIKATKTCITVLISIVFSLVLLAENGRLKNLDGIINVYQTLMAAHRGEVACEVITAKVCKIVFWIQGVFKKKKTERLL